ncbi:hypothetical protein Hanom_Chr01g00021781 [Helianthus anomalus]
MTGESKTYIPKIFYKTGGSKTYIPKNFYTKTTYITLLSEKFGGSGAPLPPLSILRPCKQLSLSNKRKTTTNPLEIILLLKVFKTTSIH